MNRALGAHVVACAFDAAGVCAFALADGALWLAAGPGEDWRRVEVCAGGLLSLAADCGGGFICGGDDGGFSHVGVDGAVRPIARWPGKWIDPVAGFTGKPGLRACAVGRALHLFDAAGAALKTLDHPSSVTGIAFDAGGKRIAAAHYNGVSLWYTASQSDHPRRLEWKGSHTAIAFHPAGAAVVTAMQENALHGWRLADGQHMQMSGYPAKTESLAFTANGRWLASSGAEAIVLWPFFGGGPMGKAPLELAGGAALCTRVACAPRRELCAAGFADGSVVLADPAARTSRLLAPAGDGAVSALGWNAAGTHVAFGTENGLGVVVPA